MGPLSAMFYHTYLLVTCDVQYGISCIPFITLECFPDASDLLKCTLLYLGIVKASNRTVQELKSSPASKSSPLMQSVGLECKTQYFL